MRIGNGYYNCSCIRYTQHVEPQTDNWLTFGVWLAAALVVLIVIIIVVVIVVFTCRRLRRDNRSKQEQDESSNNPDHPGSIELYQDDTHYSSITEPVAQTSNNAVYSRPLPAKPDQNEDKQYSTLDSVELDQNDNDTPYYLTLKDDDECVITPC